MNLTCFYCQTPFTLSMDQKVAALRKMHAENLHHYDAHCPKCGRANAVSRERLEMFTPGWEEAIKAQAMEGSAAPRPAMPAMPSTPAQSMPVSPMMPSMERAEPKTSPAPAMKAASPARRRHAPAAKKAARKAAPKRKAAAKKAVKKAAKKKTVAKKKTARAKTKSAARKTKRR
jgi:hypothetical protein